MSPETKLSARLQDDISWRIRELSELVRACAEAQLTRKAALMRAVLPIMYAHWEGYFVGAANSYLNYVTEKGVRVAGLRNEFWALTIRSRYRPNQIQGDIQFTRFLLDIKSEDDRVFKKGNFEPVNGASNLRSDVLLFCCKSIAINPDPFRPYFDFIDRELIEKRNYVAHGSLLRISESTIPDYRDKVIEIIRITSNEIENSAILGSYRKSP